MTSPFPGMDPWLEDPAGWPDVHLRLIASIGDSLAAAVSPRYVVRIEERVYVTDPEADPGFSSIVPDLNATRKPGKEDLPAIRGSPAAITAPVVVEDLLDSEIHDRTIEIRDSRSHEVVTAIEVLSPANKVHGSRGREALKEKRRKLREGGANWMEVDLLRDGQRPSKLAGRSDYCVLLLPRNRADGLAWFFNLREPLPAVTVPLRKPDEVTLDLGRIFPEIYERARYGDAVDYDRDPPPPRLRSEDLAWARERISTCRSSRPAES
jgi:hypothetical protein